MAVGTGVEPDELRHQEEQAAKPTPAFAPSELSTYDPSAETNNHSGGSYHDPTPTFAGSSSAKASKTTPEQLEQDEQQASASTTGTGAGQNGTPQPAASNRKAGNRVQRFFLGDGKRKAASLGLFGGGIIAILMTLGLSSGPLEFIHIAQLLQGPLSTFGHVNATSNYRMGKLLLDVYKTGDIGNFDAGDTRIGVLGRTLKKPILQGLESKGITPEFGTLKTFDGFTIDIANPKSPYYGMTQEKALEKLQLDIGSTDKLHITFSDQVPDLIHVSGVGFNGDAAAIDAVSNFISIKFLNGPVASYVGSRFLMRYSAARTFHPLQKLLVQKQQDLVDRLKAWTTKRDTEITDGEAASTIDTAAAKDQTTTTDANGKPVTTTEAAPGDTGPVTAPEISSKLGLLKGGLSIAGGLATVIAIICLLQTIDHNIGAIRYVQVALPMMREAMDAITVGSQVMSGKDVDINELNQLASQQFTSLDPSTHKVTSVWSSSAPIEALSGQPGGTDLNQNTKDLFSGSPAWLKWTESGAVQTLCTNTAQIIGGVASVAIGIFSGEIASTVIGLAAGALAGPAIINYVSNLLAGGAINPSTLSGAQWGGVIAYGARLAGNAQALQDGGVALTTQQVAELNVSNVTQSQAQFHSETLADRLLNPNDYRSIVGSTIDKLNLAGGPQSILADITNLPSLFSSLFKMPAMLLTATTQAATLGYQYPFPEFGFSQQDITNPIVKDPVANAKAVGTLLDNNNTNGEPDYVQKALACFGVSITKGADGWDAVPSTDSPTADGFVQDRTRGVNAYDSATYSQSSCADNTDVNWLKIRFWVLDTRTMEGYGCYMGDVASCDSVSFAGNKTSAPTGGGTPTTGSCTTPAPTGGYGPVKQALLSQFKIDLQGDINPGWAVETYNTACALSKAPAYYSKLVAQGPISITLHGGGCGSGFADASSGIQLYGFCDPNYNRFIITHELGHMFSFRNQALYKAFLNGPYAAHPAFLPTWDCQIHSFGASGPLSSGPYMGDQRAECWADMIGEYLIYFNLRESVGGAPAGSADFKQYPTQYSAYYDFAKSQLFGGVEYTSF